MTKLFLHSDHIAGNTQLDEAFFNMFPLSRPKIGYIPSQSDPTRHFFQQKVEWYKQFGVTDLLYFDLGEEYDETRISELLSCDAIFLSGGNTFAFLDQIKRRNILSPLREFAEHGGVLIGVSAGSILMSESIRIATVDSDIGGDQNEIGITDFSALGLIDVDFYPHFDESSEITERLKQYTKKTGKTVYACQDGGGIFVQGDDLRLFGKVWKFAEGKCMKSEHSATS